MSKKYYSMRFRVWHIPQVPGKPFHFEVTTLMEAIRLRDALAEYDLFQLANNIKGDYANVSGIQFYDHTISDEELVEMGLTDRWVDTDADEIQDMLTFGMEGDTTFHHLLGYSVLQDGADVILNTPGDEIGDEDATLKLVQKIYDAIQLSLIKAGN